MTTITIRFYEELNDFLPYEKKKKSYKIFVNGSPSVKNVIEREGVPHTEVDLILVNSNSVNFTYHVKNNDYISVYPVFESFDIKNVTKLRETPLRIIKFILDVHLGKLARYLRLLGFDSLYDNGYKDDEIAELSNKDNRIILTRDKGLLQRKNVKRGYWIRSLKIENQIKEVVKRFDLYNKIKPFKRCMICNGNIKEIKKDMLQYKIDKYIFNNYNCFYICLSCNKIFWKGNHYPNLEKIINNIK